jgi:hypothetical protein
MFWLQVVIIGWKHKRIIIKHTKTDPLLKYNAI